MFIESWLFSIIVVIGLLWLGFYFGTYYGKGVYRWCRYWRLRAIRFYQGRHKYNDRIILGK